MQNSISEYIIYFKQYDVMQCMITAEVTSCNKLLHNTTINLNSRTQFNRHWTQILSMRLNGDLMETLAIHVHIIRLLYENKRLIYVI